MKKTSRYLLEVIIVSFNTSSILKNCLNSLNDCLKSENLEAKTKITVVDNNSHDGSQEMVRKFFQGVNLIENKKNTGFASANNQAILQSKSEFIFLLNSDTVIHKGAISTLLSYLQNNTDIAAVGPKLINSDGSLQQSFGYSPHFVKIFFWMLFVDDIPYFKLILKPYHAQGESFYQNTKEVDWVTGASLMFRHEIIEKVGLMDEKIFMYGEEVEWCYRIRIGNKKIIFLPHAVVTHLGGASQKKPGENILSEFASIIYFYQKHNPELLLPVRLLLKTGALLRLVLFGIIRADSSKIRLYAKAFELA